MSVDLTSLAKRLEALDTSDTTRARYARLTVPWPLDAPSDAAGHGGFFTPIGVVHPDSEADLEAIVAFARAHRLPLHPISRGRNWGYGSAAPAAPGALVVDLGRMNRILEFDDTLGYVVIEPGVSQGQLQAWLAQNAPDWWMDANGAGPDASIVGNILERGFGHTELGERANHFCGLRVLLGNGRFVEGGFAAYPHCRTKYTYRHGLGPSLDGLFLQSSFGIVSRMAIWLRKRPIAFGAFFCMASSPRDLPRLIDAIAELKRQGIVRSTVHVGNRLRALSAMPYPWASTAPRTPVSETWLDQAAQTFGLGAYTATGSVSGTEEMVASALAHVKAVLADFAVQTFREADLAALASRAEAPDTPADEKARLQRFLSVAAPAFGLLQGKQTDVYLKGAGWRSRHAQPGISDPLEMKAGLAWLVPTLPAKGEEAARVEHLLTQIFAAHGFDTPLTFSFVNERTLICTSNIYFDRDDPKDAANAARCHEVALARLLEEGYLPYRMTPGASGALRRDDGTWWLLDQLKTLCDPDGILSPGRYVDARRDGSTEGRSK
ncbi:MAG: FAD-dependent oxidoreductase [Myxococcales bacterium]|nr:FAD-dependent oxidoreductase [Myxococcales bacterium]